MIMPICYGAAREVWAKSRGNRRKNAPRTTGADRCFEGGPESVLDRCVLPKLRPNGRKPGHRICADRERAHIRVSLPALWAARLPSLPGTRFITSGNRRLWRPVSSAHKLSARRATLSLAETELSPRQRFDRALRGCALCARTLLSRYRSMEHGDVRRDAGLLFVVPGDACSTPPF